MVTYEISTEHNFYNHMTIYNRITDGINTGWRVNANAGYVLYDLAVERPITIDHMTGEEQQDEIYYFRLRYLPRNYDWNNFNLTPVKEGTVGGDV